MMPAKSVSSRPMTSPIRIPVTARSPINVAIVARRPAGAAVNIFPQRNAYRAARQRGTAAWVVHYRCEGLQVRFEAGADLQDRSIDLDEAGLGEKAPHRGENPAAQFEIGAPAGQRVGPPRWHSRPCPAVLRRAAHSASPAAPTLVGSRANPQL